jgi:hypothetical protein
MLRDFIQIIDEDIRNFAWIEKYGGLVQTVTRNLIIDKDQGLFIEQVYPVSCGVTASECWDGNRYQELSPDSTKKSVAYFEEKTPLSFSQNKNGMNLAEVTTSVRFVAWLNMNLLGYDNCSISGIAVAEFLKTFLNRTFKQDSGTEAIKSRLVPYPHIYQISFKATSEELKSSRIFQKYSYEKKEHLYFYPFDFFAIDLQISAIIKLDCIKPFSLQTPIDCEPIEKYWQNIYDSNWQQENVGGQYWKTQK